MKEERIIELRRYIDTLVLLKSKGFACNNEICDALKELHKEMGFKTKENKIHIGMNGVTILNDNNPIEKFRNLISSNEDKLVLVNDLHRGIGKTKAIIETANELNIPVITKSTIEYSNQFKINKNITVYSNLKLDDMRGTCHKDGILVDECELDKIYKLKEMGYRIRGGFYHNNLLV